MYPSTHTSMTPTPNLHNTDSREGLEIGVSSAPERLQQ